jgi:hypothetical protein
MKSLWIADIIYVYIYLFLSLVDNLVALFMFGFLKHKRRPVEKYQREMREEISSVLCVVVSLSLICDILNNGNI